MNATQQTAKQGSVKIGRNGTKFHPAKIDSVYGLCILCSCPGTQQGRAYNAARFFNNVEANCKN